MSELLDFIRAHPFACTSFGACTVGFMTATLPYLQYAALLISVVAGVISLVRRFKEHRHGSR